MIAHLIKSARALPWPALSFLSALALIVTGVALVTIPGAFVAAGGLLGALTWLYELRRPKTGS